MLLREATLIKVENVLRKRISITNHNHNQIIDEFQLNDGPHAEACQGVQRGQAGDTV